jgi:hypothetical protein
MPVCETCGRRIESGQQQPPVTALAPAALYGAGAALAGCALYALVAIVTGLEVGLIAIVVGIMVGKAVRKGSRGLGGRPQQILAVLLTYFAITTSYIPVFIYQQIKKPAQVQQAQSGKSQPAVEDAPKTSESQAGMSFGKAVVVLLAIAAAAPFLSLGEGLGALISLFIIFIGLQRAWVLTGRSDIPIMGPYEPEPNQ